MISGISNIIFTAGAIHGLRKNNHRVASIKNATLLAVEEQIRVFVTECERNQTNEKNNFFKTSNRC